MGEARTHTVVRAINLKPTLTLDKVETPNGYRHRIVDLVFFGAQDLLNRVFFSTRRKERFMKL